MPDDAASPLDRPSVQAALAWAFAMFRGNRAVLMGLAAPVAGVLVLQAFAASPLENIPAKCLDPTFLAGNEACLSSVASVLVAALAIQVMFLLAAGFASIGSCRAALRTTRGHVAGMSDLLDSDNLPAFMLYVVVFGVLAVLGTILCLLPGLIAVFLLQLGPFFVLDRGYGPGRAMAASARTALRNPGPALLMTLVNTLVLVLGEMCLGILMLVMLPVATLFTAHLYRRFSHEPVV
jgi:uncharacterized membrane protein